MQWFKSAMVLSSVVFVAAMAAEGCSSKSTETGDGGDSGIKPADGGGKDVATNKDGGGTTCPASDPACENCDVSSYSPIAQGTPITHNNQCSSTDLTAFTTACNLNTTGTQANCNTWQTAENTSNAACLGCLFTEQTTASWGFLVCTSTGCSLNIPGCIDIGLGQVSQENSTSTGSCGDLFNASYGCQDAACSACSTTDFTTCDNDSIAAECKSYVDAVDSSSQCASLNTDAALPAAVAKCFSSSQTGYSDAEFTALANVFCGGG